MVSRTTSLLDSLHTTKTVASYSTATEILCERAEPEFRCRTCASGSRTANNGVHQLSLRARAETKGNAGQQSTCRTQSRVSVSQALERIRQAFAVMTRGRRSYGAGRRRLWHL